MISPGPRHLLLRPFGALALALAAAALALASPAEAQAAASAPGARIASHVSVGISDQSVAVFADPRLQWLGVRVARVVVPWDVVRRRRELGWYAAWLRAARAHGIEALVAFNADPSHQHQLPSTSAYGSAVQAFMALFPWVHDYTPWNEENHPLQPTAANPRRAAEYFNWLSAHCSSCTVTAADVLDIANMAPWLRRFRRWAHHPRLWGLHDYVDLWQGTNRRLGLLLRTVPGEVWITETGGVVWRWERPVGAHRARFVVHPEAQAALTAARLRSAATASRRVTRIYYYQWRVPHTLGWARAHRTLSWDSGLMRPDCSPRPAFSVLARLVGRIPAHMPRAWRNHAGNCV
jgi:hypothetical protein